MYRRALATELRIKRKKNSRCRLTVNHIVLRIKSTTWRHSNCQRVGFTSSSKPCSGRVVFALHYRTLFIHYFAFVHTRTSVFPVHIRKQAVNNTGLTGHSSQLLVSVTVKANLQGCRRIGFHLYTHPMPTEKPVGIPTLAPYSQNQRILRIFLFSSYTIRFYRATAYNAKHGMAMRKLSVRLSNACIMTKQNKVLPKILYHERTFILVIRHRKWLVRGDPLYVKFWAKLTPFKQKRQFLIDIRS